MVTRIFTGDDEAYMPDQGRWVKPGDEVEFDEAPDSEVWKTSAKAKQARAVKKVDVLDPEPSADHVVPDEAPATEES